MLLLKGDYTGGERRRSINFTISEITTPSSAAPLVEGPATRNLRANAFVREKPRKKVSIISFFIRGHQSDIETPHEKRATSFKSREKG